MLNNALEGANLHVNAAAPPLSGSGLEIARLAKELNPRPLVLVYTSDPTTDAMREILRTRVDYCALEPLNVREVSSALETLMARRLS